LIEYARSLSAGNTDWGTHETFRTTHDITKYTKAAICSKVAKQLPVFACFSAVAGEGRAADAERDIRGNHTPIFFFRDPLRFSDLNHAIKRDPRTGLRSAQNNWDSWALLPECLHQVTIVILQTAEEPTLPMAMAWHEH
jgi:catalase